MDERRTDSSRQLEIDEAILDYLLYTAIRALLEDTKSSKEQHGESETPAQAYLILQMVDCRPLNPQTTRVSEAHRDPAFLVMFRSMHPDQHGSEELRFRLRLLKFTALFTTRSASSGVIPSRPAFEPMRQQQEPKNSFRKRVEANGGLEPTSQTEALSTPAADKLSTTKSSEPTPRVSLLDTLPVFMALSAAHLSLQDHKITLIWMRLAAGYMAQAVAEQYLNYNSPRPEVLYEAFHFGFDPESDAQEGTDEWHVNKMFLGEDGVVEEWENIRQEHMRALMQTQGVSLQEHLEHLKALVDNELPLSELEDQVVVFLEKLLAVHPKPLLAQLAAGKLDGLSERETGALKRQLGWGEI